MFLHQHPLIQRTITLSWALTLACSSVGCAVHDDMPGGAAGYPVAPQFSQAFQETYRVGSFSAMDSLSPHCILEPAAQPLALSKAAAEPAFQYKFDGRQLALDDYMQRQRATAVLVLKDGNLLAERYNYERTPQHRLLSNSIAKTIVGLAMGKALQEGRVHSLEDTAAAYEPRLADTLYGQTRLINLMRMASGAKFVEDYSGRDDLTRFNQATRTQGSVRAAGTVTQRVATEGSTFNYSSAETLVLALVLRAATGQSLCRYVGEKIWQPMGAESRATWLTNPIDQTELAAGNFNATARDYARLGWLMANDGQRGGVSVLPRDYLLRMTDPALQPEQFRPGRMNNKGSTFFGYGLQTWLLPGKTRRFVMLGIYGQAILVDPALKLVVVHMAAAKDAAGDASGAHMNLERMALWRGIVGHYGKW